MTNRFLSEGGPGKALDRARRSRGINAQGYLGVQLAQEIATVEALETELRAIERVRSERGKIVVLLMCYVALDVLDKEV